MTVEGTSATSASRSVAGPRKKGGEAELRLGGGEGGLRRTDSCKPDEYQKYQKSNIIYKETKETY